MSYDQKLLNILYIREKFGILYCSHISFIDICSLICLIQNTILDYVQAVDGDSDNPRQIVYQFTISKCCLYFIHQKESVPDGFIVNLDSSLNSKILLFFFSIFYVYNALSEVSHNVFQNKSRL